MRFKLNNLYTLLSTFFLLSCTNHSMDAPNDKSIFRNTIADKSAKAILKTNSKELAYEVANNDSILSFQESIHGASLVHFAVRHHKCSTLQTLFNLGANFNLIDHYGETALFEAVYFSKVECVNKLLEYGANPNITYSYNNEDGTTNAIEFGTSPLILASSRNLEIVKLLIESGAEVNYKTESNISSAIVSLLRKKVVIAHFLIVENKSEVNHAYDISRGEELPKNSKINTIRQPIDLLSNWVFPLSSKEHQLKMEIVKEFENQGIDYWSRKIPQRIVDQIKVLYPNTWENYLKNY